MHTIESGQDVIDTGTNGLERDFKHRHVAPHFFVKKPANVLCPPFFPATAGLGTGFAAGLLGAALIGSGLFAGSSGFFEADLLAFVCESVSGSDSPE